MVTVRSRSLRSEQKCMVKGVNFNTFIITYIHFKGIHSYGLKIILEQVRIIDLDKYVCLCIEIHKKSSIVRQIH